MTLRKLWLSLHATCKLANLVEQPRILILPPYIGAERWADGQPGHSGSGAGPGALGAGAISQDGTGRAATRGWNGWRLPGKSCMKILFGKKKEKKRNQCTMIITRSMKKVSVVVLLVILCTYLQGKSPAMEKHAWYTYFAKIKMLMLYYSNANSLLCFTNL